LDSAEITAGVSLWTIELRFALLQHYQGLESQKAFLAEVQKARPQNDIVSFLAYYLSQRNEETTIPARFSRSILASLGSASIKPDFAAYLTFRLLGRISKEAELCAGILRYEASSALVDYYDTFVRLALNSIVSFPHESGRTFYEGLRRIENEINDHRISKAAYLVDSARDLEHVSSKDLALAESEAGGALGESEIRDLIDRGSDDAVSWYILAGLAAELGISYSTPDPSIARWVAALLIRIMGSDGDRTDAVAALERFSLNFRLTHFAPLVAWFLHLELCANPTLASQKGLFAFLNSEYLELFGLRELPKPREYDSLLANVYGGSISLTAERVRAGVLPPSTLNAATVISQFWRRLMAEGALRLGKNEDVLELVSAYEDPDATRRARRQNARVRTGALLALQRISELVEYVVDRVLDDSALGQILPLHDCMTHIEETPSARLASRISTPILVKLATDNSELPISTVLSDAYEDFLLLNDMEKPSQLQIGCMIFRTRSSYITCARFAPRR